LAFSLIGVISALITLCLKNALLEGVADTEDDSMPRPNNEEGSGLDRVPKPSMDNRELIRKISRLSEVQIEALYQLSEYESGTSRYTENPMLGSSENATKDEKAPELVEENNKMKSENAELRSKNDKMSSENAQVRNETEKMSSENRQMRNENEQMRREMENLRTRGHSQDETTNEEFHL
jgi:hypothetical protein